MSEPQKKAVPRRRGRPRQLFDRNIEKDRKISKFHLDRDAEEQPDKIGYWLDLLPKARKQVENTNLDLDILMGQKYSQYRDTLDGGLDSKGNKKLPTDTAVSRAVSCDEEVITLKRKLIEQEEYMGLITAAIKTMENVRTSLKVLNELNTQKYFEVQGYERDKYDAREVRKENVSDKKAAVGAGLKNISVPEEDLEEPEVEDIIPEEPEQEVEVPQETEEVPAETVPEEPEEDDILEEEEVPQEEEPKEEESEEEPVEDSAPNPCPFKHKFGADFGEYDECDECDCESACFQESKKQR